MDKQMRWIGLTGGIASGKSTASDFIRQQGIPVVDADEIARQVVRPGTAGLALVLSQFGPSVADSTGQLDRKKLGQLIFSDKEKRAQLEKILHPLIQQEVAIQRHNLEKKGLPFAFYDIPLLFEKKMQNAFDLIVVVSTTKELQMQRMKNRDGLLDSEIETRLRAQIPLSEKESQADFVIQNQGKKQEIEIQIKSLLEKLRTKKI